MCDYWELVGSSPAGGADNLVNEESHVDVQLDQRHMMLRGETVGVVKQLTFLSKMSLISYSCPGYSVCVLTLPSG